MPDTVTTSGLITAGTPIVVHILDTVVVTIPLSTRSLVVLGNVFIRNATSSIGPSLQPALPWYLGNIISSSGKKISASFSSKGLMPGVTFTLVVSGSYVVASVSESFSLTATILTPSITTSSVALLSSHVTVNVDLRLGLWSYKVWNDELALSDRVIKAFSLRIPTVCVVKSIPNGWAVQTNNSSFVHWHVVEAHGAKGQEVLPGQSLDGFILQSKSQGSEGQSYSLASWSFRKRSSELVGLGTTLTPSRSR